MAGISVSERCDFRTLPTGKSGNTYLVTITEAETGEKTMFACSGEQAEVMFRLYYQQDMPRQFEMAWRAASD